MGFSNVSSINEFILEMLGEYAQRPAFSIYRKKWQTVSYEETVRFSLTIAEQIKKYELNSDDKIAIILESCPEYCAAFLGSALLSHPVVLIDSKLGAHEISAILKHSDSNLLISGFNASKITVEANSLMDRTLPVIYTDEIIPKSFKDIAEIKEVVNSYSGIKSEDIALIVYTSGTTSDPKGVMITLGNILYNSQAVIEAVGPHKDATFMSILPLNHMLEFTGGMFIPLRIGAHVAYANTVLPHEIVSRFQDFKFTDMIVVPLFLTSLKKSLIREINKSFSKKIYFALCMILSDLIPFQGFRRFIFGPVLKKLGMLKRFISGGAALDIQTQRFFTKLGIVVTQGYGLTETSPVSTVSYKGDKVLGTQGRALKFSEIKIDPQTSEVLIRGPHIMKGYYKQPELNAKVFTEDNWFRSGDLGRIDTDGNLFITGRLKELIVLGSGKKVFPDEVESAITVSDRIKEFIIVGAEDKNGILKDGESVCAVIVPSDEFSLLKTDKVELRDLLEDEILKKAAILAVYKRPSKIYISTNELPKTSTRKNKRLLIKKMIEEGVFQ
jgi:long-chain acyl-CoA synthetase